MNKGVMDPSNIMNEELVRLALLVAEPSIFLLLEVTDEPNMVWGPKYLVVVVRHPLLKEPVVRKFGTTSPWHGDWGAIEDCERIASWKAEAAQREGKPTSELTLKQPWDHEPGDYLYPGGVVEGKLAVGASGINGWGDEAAAYIVLDLIEGFCKRKREQLRESRVKRLE